MQLELIHAEGAAAEAAKARKGRGVSVDIIAKEEHGKD